MSRESWFFSKKQKEPDTKEQQDFQSKELAKKMELFHSVFMDTAPKDNGEATQIIKDSWQRMSPGERMRYFTSLNEDVCNMEWDQAAKKATLQALTENILVRTFGDHHPPYNRPE